MKYKSAKKLILHTCKKYFDAKQSYKRLIIYCYMEQGYNFPLTIEGVLNCYPPETIRRTFQELKKDGEIVVSEATQQAWDEEEKKIHKYYSAKKKKREEIHQATEEMLRTSVFIDHMTGKPVNFAH